MTQLFRSMQQRWHRASPFLIGWLFLLSTQWVAMALTTDIPLLIGWHKFGERLPIIFLTGALMIASSIWIFHHRRRYFPVRTLSRCPASQRDYSTFILSVSTPGLHKPNFERGLSFPPTIDNVTLRGVSLREDIQLLEGKRWNWQQILRAFQDLKAPERLRRIYLLGSKDRGTDPTKRMHSHAWLDECRAFLQLYFPQVTIIPFETPIDFEDLEEMMAAIHTIIRREQQQGTPEREIIIDITGGQKTASIAAALVTLNSKVTFQYVQTQAPYNAIAYDVISESYFSLSE